MLWLRNWSVPVGCAGTFALRTQGRLILQSTIVRYTRDCCRTIKLRFCIYGKTQHILFLDDTLTFCFLRAILGSFSTGTDGFHSSDSSCLVVCHLILHLPHLLYGLCYSGFFCSAQVDELLFISFFSLLGSVSCSGGLVSLDVYRRLTCMSYDQR
jgi:hypothetical protein